MMGRDWPERILSGQAKQASPNAYKTGFSKDEIE
jgi:hypothetical protein